MHGLHGARQVYQPLGRSRQPVVRRGNLSVNGNVGSAMGKMDWCLRGIGLAALALMGAACSEDADDPAAKGTALLPSPTIYVAATIITMDPARPRAQAVAVAQGRVLDVGSLNEVSARHPGVSVDETFAGKVMVAGLIDQHLHPFLSAVTLTSEIVSIEDWVLPGRIFPAARGRSDYLAKLGAAEAAMADPELPCLAHDTQEAFSMLGEAHA